MITGKREEKAYRTGKASEEETSEERLSETSEESQKQARRVGMETKSLDLIPPGFLLELLSFYLLLLSLRFPASLVKLIGMILKFPRLPTPIDIAL